MLQAEHQTCRAEARKLTTALSQAATASLSLAERIAKLDERAGQLEVRLGEIQRGLAGMQVEVDPDEAAKALAAFDPVWDALVPREQASLLQLLIESVDYDGQAKEVAITFRPAGIASLGNEHRSAA
jgi:site-specific DNA recombinase